MSGDAQSIMEAQMWRSYVGRREERELLERSRCTSPCAAVQDYIARLDETFEPGTLDNAPEELADVLLRGIEHRQGRR